MEEDKGSKTKKVKKEKKEHKKEKDSPIVDNGEKDTETELKVKKDQIKGEKKLEKKKEKEERKKLKEEERQKEREEKLKEKEDKRIAEKKRELRKEQRKSWLAKNSGGNFSLDPETIPDVAETPSGKEKKPPKQAQSPDVMRRQRELEQFLLNMPIKRLRGTTWQYYDIAPASGYTETIVVLHGGGIRPEVMYEYILGFAQVFRVVAPRYPEVFTELDDYVAGVFLIMRHENIKKSHFVGLGFGSVVGLQFLYRHPGRVLSCTLAHCSLPNESKIRHVEKALKKMDFTNGPLRRLMAGSVVKPKDIEEHVFDLSLGEREMWLRNFKNFGATKQAVFSRLETLLDYHSHCSYTRSDFERWEGKMLLIESEDDEYFDDENFAALQEIFPDATQHCISRCGHLYSLIRGKVVVDIILRLLLDEDAYKDVTSKNDISPRGSEQEASAEVFESDSKPDKAVAEENSDDAKPSEPADGKKSKRSSTEPEKKDKKKKKSEGDEKEKEKKKKEKELVDEADKEKKKKEPEEAGKKKRDEGQDKKKDSEEIRRKKERKKSGTFEPDLKDKKKRKEGDDEKKKRKPEEEEGGKKDGKKKRRGTIGAA